MGAASGDRILAQAANTTGLRSYSVPVQFEVHLHKPIGIRSRVEGTANYLAPGKGALVITKSSGIVGGFFKGTYNLDLVPQTWPVHYHVVSMAAANDGGPPAMLLNAVPRQAGGDITQVVFRIDARTHAPLAATWSYKDGSSIALTFVDDRVGRYLLPATANVSVNMPKYKLDAIATYGTYALNAPVDESVFAQK